MKTVVLPNKDAMLLRLKHIGDGRPYMLGLYPALLAHAGENHTAEDVVRLLEEAIEQFAEGRKPSLVVIAKTRMLQYIEALVSDREMAREAMHISVRAKRKELSPH